MEEKIAAWTVNGKKRLLNFERSWQINEKAIENRTIKCYDEYIVRKNDNNHLVLREKAYLMR